jgi:hypothetical protein
MFFYMAHFLHKFMAAGAFCAITTCNRMRT